MLCLPTLTFFFGLEFPPKLGHDWPVHSIKCSVPANKGCDVPRDSSVCNDFTKINMTMIYLCYCDISSLIPSTELTCVNLTRLMVCFPLFTSMLTMYNFGCQLIKSGPVRSCSPHAAEETTCGEQASQSGLQESCFCYYIIWNTSVLNLTTVGCHCNVAVHPHIDLKIYK